jgi:alpha-mannosidase
MKRRSIPLVGALLILGSLSAAHGEIIVKTEQINPADPAWKFKTIPGPSKSDIATDAKVTIVGNQFEPAGGDGAVLVNGRLPNDSLDLSEEALLSNSNADGGRIVIDLGQVQPVAAVCSYSWHEYDADQGSRAPQVYTLYGSAAEKPDAANLGDWTKIAEVDTRPNRTGAKWNGQHGVFVSDSTGKLGDFRYLLFAVQPTRSPRQADPAMTNTLFAEIDVHTAATLSKAGDAVVLPAPPKVTDVWVAFKTHFDIGYTDTIEGVLRKYRVQMMNSALSIIDQERQLPPEKRFAWMIPGWPLAHILGPKQDPARRARIERAVREGALGVGAIPFSLHTETEDLEDLVRGLGYASKIARQYGRPLPIAAKMTDVPCHSWVWPTLLAHAGVKFLQLGSNDNSGHLRVPHLFWWEGPDGSRVLCNYTPRYGSGIQPPRDWPSKNYLAMIMTYDNQGPPSLADVENLRRYAEKNMPGVRVHFGTLDDFARAVLAEKPELAVVRADMPDTWIHGWMSMPIESRAAHTVRPLEPAVETLDTQLRAWGMTPGDLAPALAEAYEQSILYSEHTFGPAAPNMGSWNSRTLRNLYGDAWKAAFTRGAYKKYEAVFDGKRAYARKEAEIVHREIGSRLDLLAKSVATDGPRVVVYNALPWPRSGMVEIPSQPGEFMYAQDVPANGYRTIVRRPFQADNSASQSGQAGKPNVLETPFYRVELDLRRGGIASLVEKKTGRELVDRKSRYALGQFLHERFNNQRMAEFSAAYNRGGFNFMRGSLPGDATYAALTPPAWNLAVERTDQADIATLTAADTLGLAKGITLVITLPREQPWVDVEWRVNEKTPDPVPEGGWLCFPLAVEQPHYTLGRLGGPIDPAKQIVPGANKDYFCLSAGLTIRGDDSYGVGICPIDSPCVSLGEPGLWRYSQTFRPQKSTVFVNLYNNEWMTNFPEWQAGSWSSRVRLWPTHGEDISKNLIVPAWEARLPLLAAVADGPGGSLPASQSGLALSRPGVLVTAFGPDPDGVNKGTLLRVWEQAGVTGPLTVTLPEGLKAMTAAPVNLRGERSGTPVLIKDGKLKLTLNAYAPASFSLH